MLVDDNIQIYLGLLKGIKTKFIGLLKHIV